MIKYFLVILCLCPVVMASLLDKNDIDPGEIAELNYIFRETPYDSALLEIYASYLITRRGIDDGLINSTAIQIYNDLYGSLSAVTNITRAQKLLQNISNQMKIMFRVLKQQGIQQETMLAMWLPLAYNDMINVLSLHANKLNRSKLKIIDFGRSSLPNIATRKPNITARNEFIIALSKARIDANSLKVLLPKLIKGINQKPTKLYDNFKDFLTKLSNSAYNGAAISKKSYANAIKALIEDASQQVETIFRIFVDNGVNKDAVILEILVEIFTDMTTELIYFQTAI